jgi:hypothetical protein
MPVFDASVSFDAVVPFDDAALPFNGPQTLIEGLRAFMAATPAVVALVSGSMHPNEGLQGGPTPRTVVKVQESIDDNSIDLGNAMQATAKVIMTCYGGRWGPGYTTARTLADAVLNADGGLGAKTLGAYSGLLGFVQCQSCQATDDEDLDAPAIDGSGRGEQSVQLTFSIAYVKQV